MDLGCSVRTIKGNAKLIVRSAHAAAVIAFLERGPRLRRDDGREVGELRPRHVVIHADFVDDFEQRLKQRVPSRHGVRVKRRGVVGRLRAA